MYEGLSIQERGTVVYRVWEGWPDIDVPLPLRGGIDTIYVHLKVDRRQRVVAAVVTPEGVTEVVNG